MEKAALVQTEKKDTTQTHHGLNYGQLKLLSAPVTG